MTKLKHFIFELAMENFFCQFTNNLDLFTQKIVIKLSKIWFGIRDPYSGVKKAPDP
jgi:hypothetical protein